MSADARVLVTGAAGFIGSHVAEALDARGVETVRALRPGHDQGSERAVALDYADADAVRAVVAEQRVSTLVHCAWRLAPNSEYLRDPANVDELRASLALFAAAADAGCTRIVGLGTCLEYEESDGTVAEDAPLRPATVYGASKAALFLAASAWARARGVSFAWARLYFPYGPREAPHRLVPSVVRALLRGERAATTAGEQRRSFVYVEDVAEAIALLARTDAEGPFNVAADDAIPVRELVERVGAAIGRAELLDVGALPSRPGDPAVLAADVTRLHGLGWSPRTPLDDGLALTVAWWRERQAAA